MFTTSQFSEAGTVVESTDEGYKNEWLFQDTASEAQVGFEGDSAPSLSSGVPGSTDCL